MNWWQAAVLGLVQGLTEFIPISSTAHLRIVPALLGWPDPGAAFSAVIQLGTLAAVFVYFAADIRRLATGAILWPLTRRAEWREPGVLAWTIAAGNMPIVVLGLAGREFIETGARSLYLIGAMLVAVALALALAERWATQQRVVGGLGFWRVMAIGAFQALALIPGASRSGSAILGGLIVGLQRSEAARFSFLLGIPPIFGAGLFQSRALIENMGGPGAPDWASIAAGLATAAIGGYASIGFLLHYLRTHTTMVFVQYRLVVGVLLILLTAYGWLK